MVGAVTLRFSTQAQLDIQHITRELSDLQRQVASTMKANDLQGFGDASSRIISAQTLRVSTDARASAIQQVGARFGVQSAALGQVATAAGTLAQSIRDALSANDGRAIHVDLGLAFSSVVSALNETWNGQPLFAGERVGAGPVKITSLDDLLTSTTVDQIFQEAERHQTFDLGVGDPVALASKASEMSMPLFDALRSLKQLVDASGGEIGAPMTDTQKSQLEYIAVQLEHETGTFNNAEGRSGQLETRFDAEHSRLQARSDLLLKEIGADTDADIAQVSVRINSLLAQYQAAAKTFSDLSKLTLISYL